MTPDAAVEAAAEVTFLRHGAKYYTQMGPWTELEPRFRTAWLEDARAALEAAAPFMAAQALRDAVDAFPLETITAPDNAVAWLMRRAEQLGT